MKETQQEKYKRMTEAPVKGLILRLAAPTMVSMLVTSFYNLADTYFVGQLANVNATAAVTVAYSLMNVIQAIGFYFWQGSGSFISRALGQKDYENCKKMASTAFFSSAFVGLMLLVFGMIFTPQIAVFCGSSKDSEALNYAVSYIRIILVGAPFMCASIVLNNQLRFQGNATFAMIGLASGAVLNVGLDAILVPRLEVTGAAIATVSCQIFSFTVLLIASRRFSDNVKFSIKDFSFRFFFVKEIFKGGFPSLCRQGIASFMNVSLMNCCKICAGGEITSEMLQAAFGIVSKLTMFISSMMIGFGQGFQPVCGFNYGAKKYDRVKEGYRFCVIVTFLFLFAMAVVFYIICPWILARMQASNGSDAGEETVRFAVQIMRRHLLSLPVMSFVVMSNMMLQTTGHVVGASVLAMARQGLTLIPSMFLLSALFGFAGLQWAQVAADVVAALITIPFVISMMREMRRNRIVFKPVDTD